MAWISFGPFCGVLAGPPPAPHLRPTSGGRAALGGSLQAHVPASIPCIGSLARRGIPEAPIAFVPRRGMICVAA